MSEPALPASLSETFQFLQQFYTETQQITESLEQRQMQVRQEWTATGRYTPTTAELTFGARVAWRNSVRCIGRLFWPALQVRDLRHITQPQEVFVHLVAHLKDAFCGGQIQPIISIFGGGIRVLNPQLLRYAGYTQADGSCLGDPENAKLTSYLQTQGWAAPPIQQRTPFDVLPLALADVQGRVHLFTLPPQAIQEVNLVHPEYPEIATLGLKWPALPVISDAALRIGGATFDCAPFNGWYMQTEIAARNLADATRYNLLPKVAQALALDSSHERTLWRDRALLELNVAVLHSFSKAGVKLVDHHSAAQQFERFQKREAQAGREVRGQWSWLIAPMSPATSAVWGQRFNPQELTPCYIRQPLVCPVPHTLPAKTLAGSTPETSLI